MRPLISLLILFGMPMMFFNAFSGNSQERTASQEMTSASVYCNSRFNFCVNYPSTLLPVQEASANDDGVVLRSGNGTAKLTANGSYNVLNWTPQELFDFTVEHLNTTGEQKINVISSIYGADYYEVFFLLGNNSYYTRSFFVNDHYVSMIIEVPVNYPDLMEELKNEVTVTFEEEGDNG